MQAEVICSHRNADEPYIQAQPFMGRRLSHFAITRSGGTAGADRASDGGPGGASTARQSGRLKPQMDADGHKRMN
jgi:hypothetical protein